MNPVPTPPLRDQIPSSEEIVRRLGETAAERRILRAMLKAAKLKEQTGREATEAERREVAGAH